MKGNIWRKSRPNFVDILKGSSWKVEKRISLNWEMNSVLFLWINKIVQNPAGSSLSILIKDTIISQCLEPKPKSNRIKQHRWDKFAPTLSMLNKRLLGNCEEGYLVTQKKTALFS